MDNKISNSPNKNIHLRQIWENHIHYGYILPNLKYKENNDSFYFSSEKGINFLNEFCTDINLNLYEKRNFIRVVIKEFNLILNKNEQKIYNIQYQLCKVERDDGVLCIVGIPDFLYFNNYILNKIGKCIEMHILKIDNKKVFNLNYIFERNFEDENNENSENINNIQNEQNFTDFNKISENIQERLNKIDSIKLKPIPF